MKLNYWISAFRLRTLFLSLSCIGAGIICASANGFTNGFISLFTILTCLFLQILSNIANDYGDSIHGADHDGRKGPQRAVQSGKISKQEMKKAIYILSALSLISGVILLYLAVETIGSKGALLLFIFGLLSIFAAITYTNGKNPYGYMGLGDVSVFVFFGLTAVLGTYYLQTGTFKVICLFPAIAYGLLSVGVLNINNMRDIESDKVAGKNSIPVRIGLINSKMYHFALLTLAGLCLIIYTYKADLNWLFILPLAAVIAYNIKLVHQAKTPASFDPLLKVLSLSTFIITLLFYFIQFI